MFKIVCYTQFKFLPIIGFFVLVLSSCADEKRIQSNYIPINSCAVINVNTEKIFNDAVFDLMSNNDLGVSMSLLPLSGIIQDPSGAGLKVFAKYHIFVSSSNAFDVNIGAILPLDDSEDLVEYIEENFKVEVIEKDGFKAAKISDNHNLIWDDYTAIYYFGQSEEDFIERGKKFFTQGNKVSLASTDSTFSYALNKNVHISTWIRNDDLVELMNKDLLDKSKFSGFPDFLTENKIFTSGKTVFLTSFNKGNITIKQRQYLTSGQTERLEKIGKENDISALVPMAISESPMVLLSTTLEPDVFIEIIKLLGFDLDWDKQIAHFPVVSEINQLSDYFQGDVLVLVDGFEEVVKVKEVPDIDDEGNDILVSKEVIEKNPIVSIGLTVKDSIKFNFMINLLSSKLPKVGGFFNYDDETYFAVKGNYFFLTSTKNGIKPLNEMDGKLSSNLNSLVTRNQSVYYFDVSEILKQDERFDQFSIVGADNLNNILFFKNNYTNKGIAEGEIRVNFTNQQNGFVSTLKLFSALFSALNPQDSMGVIKF